MELQFEKTMLRHLNPVFREVRDQELTQEIRLSDGMPDIGRVIWACGQPMIRGKEWRTGSLSLTGGVMIRVLYTPEDATEARSIEEWIPFRMKWDLPEGVPEGQMRAHCILRFVDGRNVSPRKIMVRCGVSALMEAWTPAVTEVAVPGQPEGIQLLKECYPIRLSREAGEKAFVIEEELTFPPSCPKPGKLICCTLNPLVTEEKVLGDKAVIRGTGQLHVLYICENGQLHTWDFELPFSQFAQLEEDCGPDARLDVMLGVTSLEPELAENGLLRVKCGMVAQYLMDDRQMLELAADAYAPGRELSVDMDRLELPAVLETRTESLSSETAIQMDADVVTDCLFLPEFPELRRNDQGVELLLQGQVQVLCYGAGGELRTGTGRWEKHMVLPSDEGNLLYGDISPGGSCRITPGAGEITVSCGSDLRLRSIGTQGLPMVKGLNLGEIREPDPGRPSLILRRAGQEGLWPLAKEYGTTVEAIREANGLEDLPSPERMLLIPVP